MKRIILLFLVAAQLSCLRLDDNFFEPLEIDEYKFDDYSGEVDFKLNTPFYNISDTFIHCFTIPSKSSDEEDATTIFAVYIGDLDSISKDTVIMYCHGNRDHMDFYWPRAKLLANTMSKMRFGVLMIDYRGYGKSHGKSTESSLNTDVDAALNWLKSNGLSDDRLIIYGFSMGSAPATNIAAYNYSMNPSKLMLEAPFSSAEMMVQDASGLAMPGDFVTDMKVENGEVIKHVKQPFFWIHGIDDDFLSIENHGEVVYNNYNGIYKEQHRIPGADHSTIQTTMLYDNYLKIVGDFITKK